LVITRKAVAQNVCLLLVYADMAGCLALQDNFKIALKPTAQNVRLLSVYADMAGVMSAWKNF
jgi:hypothetical protein